MRFFLPFAVLVCAAVASAFASSPASAVASCGRAGYSYAGLQAIAPAHGVRVDLVALGDPQVEHGHVAAWIGVGGPGQGAGGSDAWLQVGFSSYAGTANNIYFEVTQPGAGTHYTEVVEHVEAGSRHRLAVLEVHRRPGWWRVWVDGKPVSQPLYLPGSNGRWSPIATAETWDGGRPVCNLFSYRFGRVAVAGEGGAWRNFQSGYRFQSPGYRVIGSRKGFVAQGVRPLPHPPSATRALEPVPTVQPTTDTPAADAADSVTIDG